jgi:ribonuclease/clavin/mitogillin
VTVPTVAASVILARGPGSDELFVVRRADNLRFLGGFTAFPGGKVATEDAALAASIPGAPVRQVAAIRELFEETGVLLARGPNGSLPPQEQLSGLRRDLLDGRTPFTVQLTEHHLRLDLASLTEVGALVTPPFSSLRFDTTFYFADLPPGQEATVWPGELHSGGWHRASDVLAAWNAGTLLLSPPAVSLLETVAQHPVQEMPTRSRSLFARLARGGLPPIWFSPAVRALPLRSEALPPAAYTNAYLLGTGPRYLIDPGPVDPAEQQVLFDVLDEEQVAGRALDAILLTHHHPDHIGAAAACAARYRIPVLAHPRTASLLTGRVRVTRTLAEGDTLELGQAPHGRGGWGLHPFFTPGHAPGHLAFWEPDYGLLFTGDIISTLSSIVVAPPEGDLTEYLASLRRVQGLPARLLLPAHGSPSARPAYVLAETLEHRALREQQLREALHNGEQTVADLVRTIYHGLPDSLLPLADGQIRAGLVKLEREEIVEQVTSESWRLRMKC